MDGVSRAWGGLRPTRRQWAILAFYLILLTAIFVPLTLWCRASGMLGVVCVGALFAPWLLGVLIVTLDERGPVRNWAGPLLLSLFYPTLALWYDWSAVDSWMRFGTPPDVRYTAVVNIVFVGGFAAYTARMLPRRCPSCARRSLIPLLRLWRQEQRLAKTRWCASCGAKYWRDRKGAWQVERRKTWVDAEAPQEAKG